MSNYGRPVELISVTQIQSQMVVWGGGVAFSRWRLWGLGTKPPAAGRFYVIFWKKKLFKCHKSTFPQPWPDEFGMRKQVGKNFSPIQEEFKVFWYEFEPKVERRQKKKKKNRSSSQAGSVLGRNPGSIEINSHFLAWMSRALSFCGSTLHLNGRR